ncbi:MAG: polyprenyl synthetase family protein [Candidatus Helarchaeota archaeon]
MTFQKVLAEEKRRIEASLSQFFDSFSKAGTFTHQFVNQFYADLKNYILFGGKRLRPISLVQIYKGLGGKHQKIYDVAICVELLHNASLVHDDIIDHDLVRRGQPSFHAFYQSWFEKHLQTSQEQLDFGEAMGILGGDLLIDLGQQVILSSDFAASKRLKAVRYYQEAFKELVEGVVTESYLQHLPIEKVSEEDYLNMITGKTSALFEKSLLIGSVLADESEKYQAKISEFAILLGRAFQIRDDILGVFGDPAKTGKSVEGDIREGKKTLLAIYGSKNSEIRSLYGKSNITPEEIQRVRQLLEEEGALARTKKKALDLSNQARTVLKTIELDEEVFQFFDELVMYVQDRIR